MGLRWVVHDSEATLRGPGAVKGWDTWYAIVRPEKSGYRILLKDTKGKLQKLPNRSVSMEKMMALAVAHVKLGG